MYSILGLAVRSSGSFQSTLQITSKQLFSQRAFYSTQNLNIVNNNKENVVDNSFAVVHLGGKQYKVIKGDVIMSDRIHVEVGEHIILDKVLMLGTKEQTMIGTPLVDGAKVHAFIEEQSKAPKVTIFKRKRRKNYMRTTAFTPLATVLRIGDIVLQSPPQN
ncbi:ribosomal protein L21 [Heterostelium album PN500]|uniref:Large ribosomal subunit protein bL21m n=1 Tax=Heterostelium pallidum (strain ATCC 26659 / Pp 5 / PN500) TaxID=670386 RepID=D3BEA7_HETP5|nr:ribosomal protein L21 [Heterostelium album PN500]EFA80238.1 ribosomal protein L21 [Heterostelium album PN500]|eukprot:XP_020432358.1 ribosomal protein L21 [Heterostelium album PN500]